MSPPVTYHLYGIIQQMKHRKEKFIRWLFTILAFASLVFLTGIVIVLVKESVPLFTEVRLRDFIFGREWYPTYDPPDFGILPLIMASVWVTAGALVVSVPLGIGTALFINELASHRQKIFLKPLVELLASIPSIIYGLFGMVILAPFLQELLNIPIERILLH